MADTGFDPDTTPVIAPPPGATSNLIDPPSMAGQERIVIYTLLPLMLVILAVRIYARLRSGFNIGADDYLSLVAAVSVCAYCAIMLSILDKPLGYHLYDVPISGLTDEYQKLSLLSQVMYAISAIFVKSTLLVLYLRIFNPVHAVRAILWTALGVMAVFYLTCMTINIVQCTPRSNVIDEWLLAAQACGQPSLVISCVQGVFSVVTDFFVLLIPVTQVSALTLPLKKKIGVLCIFLTGLFACACSLGGCIWRFKMRLSPDYTWVAVPVASFGTAEITVGLICSCLPVMMPILVKMVTGGLPTASLLQYIRARWPSRGTTSAGDAALPSRGYPLGDGELPRIPRARLTGLRSFIRGAYRSQTSKLRTHGTELSTYGELNSVDYDYHTQLRAMALDRVKVAERPSFSRF